MRNGRLTNVERELLLPVVRIYIKQPERGNLSAFVRDEPRLRKALRQAIKIDRQLGHAFERMMLAVEQALGL